MSSLDEIANAVLQWQRQHPLAQPLGPDAVTGIGLVALPFVRAAEGSEPAPVARWKFWQRAASGDRPAFSEDFIEGLSAEAVARFALQHGVEAAPGHEDWPLRRVAVDSELAEAAAGGWPYERWLATAAVDGPQGRRRVLVSLQEREPRAVIGRRHWDRRRLAVAALLPVALLALALALWPAAPAKPPVTPPKAAGAVEPAVLPALPPPQASAAVAAASAPASAAPTLPAGSEPPIEASAPASAPLIDIRPRLGPPRANAASRPPIGAGGAVKAAPGAAPSGQTAAPALTPSSAASADPERPALRPVPPGSTPFALVSPGFATRAEAQALLDRMLDHARKTVAPESRLQGELIETPQGHRAAVYPFASREEAALINATMVARGWKTRAVEF